MLCSPQCCNIAVNIEKYICKLRQKFASKVAASYILMNHLFFFMVLHCGLTQNKVHFCNGKPACLKRTQTGFHVNGKWLLNGTYNGTCKFRVQFARSNLQMYISLLTAMLQHCGEQNIRFDCKCAWKQRDEDSEKIPSPINDSKETWRILLVATLCRKQSDYI